MLLCGICTVISFTNFRYLALQDRLVLDLVNLQDKIEFFYAMRNIQQYMKSAWPINIKLCALIGRTTRNYCTKMEAGR